MQDCSSLIVRSYPGGPPGSSPEVPTPTPGQIELPTPDVRPHAQWVDNGRRLAVTLGGSSSCPVKPKSLTVVEEDRLTVEIGRSDSAFFGTCTTDVRFTTYEMNVPEGVSRTDPVTVMIGVRKMQLPVHDAP